MKIEGTQLIHAPPERVFHCLIDPEVLKRCIPGCERLEKTAENVYAATIRTGVGAIKGVFNGTARLEDMRPPEQCRIVVDAKGTPGFVKGTGDLHLVEKDDGTLVTYAGDLQLGGTIASVGQRMVQATSKMMATQFFTSLEAEAKADIGDPPPKHGFFRTALRWFSGWLRRMLK